MDIALKLMDYLAFWIEDKLENKYNKRMKTNSKHSTKSSRADGFAGQRLLVMSQDAVKRSQQMPVVRELFLTDIGHFPNAEGHFIDRFKAGAKSNILIYCVEGEGRYQLAGHEPETLRRGNVLLIPAGTPHVYGTSDVDPWSIYWLHFSGLLSNDYLTTLQGQGSSPTLYVPFASAVIEAFDEIYRWTEEGPTDMNLVAASTAMSRFFGLLAVLRRSEDVRLRDSEQRIRDSITYMRSHANRQLTLDHLAAQVDLSTSHYSTLFKKTTGISPINFFLQLKIRRACELLDTTSKQILEISLELGFEDAYYFSRLFKKIVGKSPRQYRKTLEMPR